MKIAVPVTSSYRIDSHFGHCESYAVFAVSENNQITEVQSVKSPEGCGCKSNIASVLADNGVTIMLAGGIGGGAISVLNSQVIRGCEGDAKATVKLYVDGLVKDSGSSCHKHDEHKAHGGDHQCSHN